MTQTCFNLVQRNHFDSNNDPDRTFLCWFQPIGHLEVPESESIFESTHLKLHVLYRDCIWHVAVSEVIQMILNVQVSFRGFRACLFSLTRNLRNLRASEKGCIRGNCEIETTAPHWKACLISRGPASMYDCHNFSSSLSLQRKRILPVKLGTLEISPAVNLTKLGWPSQKTKKADNRRFRVHGARLVIGWGRTALD